MTEGQAHQIDLDPVHSMIRLSVTAETVTLEAAEDIYRHLSEAAASGGPYAAIFDFSAASVRRYPPTWSGILLAAVHPLQRQKYKMDPKQNKKNSKAYVLAICRKYGWKLVTSQER